MTKKQEEDLEGEGLDYIEIGGEVLEILPGFTFRVKLVNDMSILCKGAGKLRKKRIRISVMDNVTVKISKYDLNFGIIVRRN